MSRQGLRFILVTVSEAFGNAPRFALRVLYAVAIRS